MKSGEITEKGIEKNKNIIDIVFFFDMLDVLGMYDVTVYF